MGISLALALALNEISSDVTASVAGVALLRSTAGNSSVSAKRDEKIEAEAYAASFAAGFGSVGVAVSGAAPRP